jgi:hypothetical protein
VASRLPSAEQAQDLSLLLAPASAEMAPAGSMPGAQSQPYLPNYGNGYGTYGTPTGYAPAAPNGQPAGQPYYGPTGVVPPYMTNPGAQPESTGKGRPNENAPQSRLDQGAFNLPSQAEVELRVRDAVARALGQFEAASEIATQPTPGTALQPAPEIALRPANEIASRREAATPERLASASTAMPSVVAVQLGDSRPHPAPTQAEVTDVLPTVHYVPNARAVQTISSHADIAAAQAASIRRHQSDPDTARTGQSNPPPDDSITATGEDAQYTVPQLLLAQNQNSQQIARPSTPPRGQTGNIPDTGSQQYSQPRVAPAPAPAPRGTQRACSTPCSCSSACYGSGHRRPYATVCDYANPARCQSSSDELSERRPATWRAALPAHRTAVSAGASAQRC